VNIFCVMPAGELQGANSERIFKDQLLGFVMTAKAAIRTFVI
jgi:hypothetical protein